MNIFDKIRVFLDQHRAKRAFAVTRAALERSTEAAQTAIAEGRIGSATRKYEEAVALYPDHGAFLHYNLGCILDRYVGDGLAARRHYMAALGVPCGTSSVPQKSVDATTACCCENMMLLSLSYDEYDQWANRLQRIQPQEPILSGQWPGVRKSKDEGYPWWEVLDGFTSAYCNFREPARDQGLYGKAASVHSLIIDNHVELRLTLNDYYTIGGVYSAEVLKVCAQHGMAADQHSIDLPAEELAVVLKKAVPRLEEYMRVFPEEKRVVECVSRLRKHMK